MSIAKEIIITIITIIIFALLLFWVSSTPRGKEFFSKRTDYKIIKCDSGFSTGKSAIANLSEGIIYWSVTLRDHSSSRRMLPGEICKKDKYIP